MHATDASHPCFQRESWPVLLELLGLAPSVPPAPARVAVHVAHEHLVAVLGRPAAAEVDHGAAVGVAAAGGIAAVVAAVRVGADIVEMVGDGVDVGVSVRVEMVAGLAQIPPPLDDVETM